MKFNAEIYKYVPKGWMWKLEGHGIYMEAKQKEGFESYKTWRDAVNALGKAAKKLDIEIELITIEKPYDR